MPTITDINRAGNTTWEAHLDPSKMYVLNFDLKPAPSHGKAIRVAFSTGGGVLDILRTNRDGNPVETDVPLGPGVDRISITGYHQNPPYTEGETWYETQATDHSPDGDDVHFYWKSGVHPDSQHLRVRVIG